MNNQVAKTDYTPSRKPIPGFTLIELLVVIAIIALLLSIVTPALRKAKEHAQRVICGSNSRQTAIGLITYAQNNDGRLIEITNDQGNPNNPLAWHSVIAYSPNNMISGTSTPRPMHLAVLYDLGLIGDPGIFYCPSQPRTSDYPIPYYYDFYTDNGTRQWGSFFPQIPGMSGHLFVRTSYNYWTYDQTRLNRIGSHRPFLVDNLQHWKVIPHRRGNNLSHPPLGVTAVYPDGHAAFVTDSGNYVFDPDIWQPDAAFDNGPGNRLDAYLTILQRLQGN